MGQSALLEAAERVYGRALCRLATCRRPFYLASSAIAELYDSWEVHASSMCSSHGGGALSVSTMKALVDSLTSCRRAAWGHGAMSFNFAWDLQKVVDLKSKTGCRPGLLEEYSGLVPRNVDRARGRVQRTKWVRTQSMDESRPFGLGAPLGEPRDDEDPAKLPAATHRFGMRNTRGPCGPRRDNQSLAAAQMGAAHGANAGEATTEKPGDSPISCDDSLDGPG